MLSTMTRLEDTVRAPRMYRGEVGEEDGPKAVPDLNGLVASTVATPSYEDELGQASKGGTDSDTTNKNTNGASNNTNPSGNTGPTAGTGSSSSNKSHAALSQEETIELTRKAVENGIQETKRSLAGNEAVSDMVRPKLTIDLGHSHIFRIPELVVDIIKDEVERLSLSNNQLFHLPYRFAECAHLRYLNIRANSFREIPKGVYKLPLLEILDLSRNKISKISDEIRKLTSLRVFSIMQNRLDDLPVGLADMNKLQILKVAGNSLKYPLRRVLETKEADMATSSMTDSEKEVALTAELKRFLKSKQPAPVLDAESSSEVNENISDMPKPIKRGASSRFPVIPSTGDSSTDPRSPPSSRPPPIPMRSHYRIASGQSQGSNLHHGSLQRLGIAPVPGVSERNRSNSEGIISIAARNKRMGVITRMNADLGTLDETRPYRNSHLRGLSHGSILRTTPSGGTSGSSSSSPGSPRGERRRMRDGLLRRMSSLPEHKEEEAREPLIEGAKGILYSLFQIHPHISTLINVIKGDDSRRNSLELVFYNASSHVDQLNEALEDAENVPQGNKEFAKMQNEAVRRECQTCIMAYTHVGTQLRHNIDKIVAHGDARYVRSLILMVYGSLVELRNACINLGVPLHMKTKKQSVSLTGKRSLPESLQGEPGPERLATRTATPTKERPQPMRRYRSDTMIQHSQGTSGAQFGSSARIPMTLLGGDNYHLAMSPGFVNPNSVPLNFGGRSRSNSRSNTLLSTSVPSSLATPRSGESFPPIPNSAVNRINPMTGLDELEEERIFEKIFYQLTSASNTALQALPLARRQFTRCLEIAEEARESEQICMLWNNLIRRCRVCLDASEALGLRLSNMKVKEPGGGMRNQREFWQLCKNFMQSFVDLVTDMRDVRSLQQFPSDIIIILRPVQKASREAGRLIEASPWSYLADMASGHPPAIYGPPLQTQNPQHHPSASAPFLSNGTPLNSMSSGSSPHSVPLPATPLSAALGPAAQATIPSTPASVYSDKLFAGDVFQRAHSLMSMQSQAPFLYRR